MPSPAVLHYSQVDDSLGQTVRVRGTAVNAKLAGMVHADGFAVYTMGLEWPSSLVDTVVEVEGQLQMTNQFAAQVSKSGEISQGTAGGDLILVNVVQISPPPPPAQR